jgi:transitional endoplasmic reticulum ATPase
LLEDKYSIHSDFQKLLKLPNLSEENFSNSLDEFRDVLELVLIKLYKYSGAPLPNQTVTISSPERIKKNIISTNGLERMKDLPEDLKGKLLAEKPNVHFEDIGGQELAKKEIQGLVNALKHPEQYKRWGTRPPKGALLFGPPGTGKTLLVKALATETEAKFLHLQASDIASKWYGESEKIVSSTFDFAKKIQGNVILFLDEVDSIVPKRDGAHEATQRTISTLLENMDGLESSKNIFIIASTNRLDHIDQAFLRSGRIDKWINVPLPDLEGRKEILHIHMNEAEEISQRPLFNNLNMDQIAETLEKHSGADIAEIIRRVLEEKVREEIASEEPSIVTTEDILKEIHNYEKVKKEQNKAMGFLGME